MPPYRVGIAIDQRKLLIWVGTTILEARTRRNTADVATTRRGAPHMSAIMARPGRVRIATAEAETAAPTMSITVIVTAAIMVRPAIHPHIVAPTHIQPSIVPSGSPVNVTVITIDLPTPISIETTRLSHPALPDAPADAAHRLVSSRHHRVCDPAITRSVLAR